MMTECSLERDFTLEDVPGRSSQSMCVYIESEIEVKQVSLITALNAFVFMARRQHTHIFLRNDVREVHEVNVSSFDFVHGSALCWGARWCVALQLEQFRSCYLLSVLGSFALYLLRRVWL